MALTLEASVLSPPGHDSQGLDLPPPDADAIASSTRLIDLIVERIERGGGAVRFDEYMRLALYRPGLGYYAGAATRFGAGGDFVTAPEISPLFGACLGQQAEDLFAGGCAPAILEFGAGTGRLCAQLLESLPGLERYLILELSGAQKQRQQDYLQTRLAPQQLRRIEWINALPECFDGLVIANEVLDAMPVHLLEKRGDWIELGVGYDGAGFCWRALPPAAEALAAIEKIESAMGELPQAYRCEINLELRPWFNALQACCRRAVVLLVDYGYEQPDYYHPARSGGTLACYYRHRRHADPLIFPGLQDISADVDFDACADAAEACGFEILGLVSQRRFLLANGLLEQAEQHSQDADMRTRLALAQQVKTLTLPEEMGSRIKVLAMHRNLAIEIPAMQRQSARG